MRHISQTEIRRLDFTLLLVMRGLLRHRRTTLVAEELGLSQSAISYALGRLRSSFGDPLFVRRPYGLEPTRHALALAPRIEALLLGAEAAIGLNAGFDPATTDRGFRIATLDYPAILLAPRLLRLFEREAPGARFAMHVLRGVEAADALRRDDVDLALGQFLRPLDGLELLPLPLDRYRLVARAGHPLVRGRVRQMLFERLNHVSISVDGDFRSFTDQAFQDAGLSRRVVATAPTFPIAFATVGATDVVAAAPGRLAAALAVPFGLEVHDLPRALPPIRLVVARRPPPDPAVSWLSEKVVQAMTSPEGGS